MSGLDERAAIVAWLRQVAQDAANTAEAEAGLCHYMDAAVAQVIVDTAGEAANAIERGDHLANPTACMTKE